MGTKESNPTVHAVKLSKCHSRAQARAAQYWPGKGEQDSTEQGGYRHLQKIREMLTLVPEHGNMGCEKQLPLLCCSFKCIFRIFSMPIKNDPSEHLHISINK